MSTQKSFTALLAIVSIFLMAGVAYGLTQLDQKDLIKKGLRANQTLNKETPSSTTDTKLDNNKVTQKTSDQPNLSQVASQEKPSIQNPINSEVIKNISALEFIKSKPELNVFASAIKAAGLDEFFNSDASYTVFVPNNESFTKFLPAEELANLQKEENKELLANIIRGHIVDTKIKTNDMQNQSYLSTLQGGNLLISKNENLIGVDGIELTDKDNQAGNAVIHIINRVIPQ